MQSVESTVQPVSDDEQAGYIPAVTTKGDKVLA